MNAYRDIDNPNHMVVWDNIYTGERFYKLMHKDKIARFIEAIKGQGCPCSYWSLGWWVKVEKAVELSSPNT